MGKSATAAFYYGFIIDQPDVLLLLQKLQNRTEKVTTFGYGGEGEAEHLRELLYDHLMEKGLSEEDFDLRYLTSGEEEFNGLAILYNKADGQDLTVWGLGSQAFESLSSAPWDDKKLGGEADAAFKRLSDDSLFKELGIKFNPGWLLGCNMDY